MNMDTTTSLKRRRPHTYNDGLHLYHQPEPSFVPAATSSFSSQQHFVIQQAAAILGLPPTELYWLSSQYYSSYIVEKAAGILNTSPQDLVEAASASRAQKRSRRASDFPLTAPMAPHRIEGPLRSGSEKRGHPALFTAHDQTPSHQQSFFPLPLSQSSSFLATTASGVVGCLANLATCQTSPAYEATAEYGAIPTTESTTASVSPESSQYLGSKEHAADPRAASFVQAVEPYHGGVEAPPVTSWLSDDVAGPGQYMQSYPALQPAFTAQASAPTVSHAQLTQVQPTTHCEAMFYPDGGLASPFPKTEEPDGISEPTNAAPAVSVFYPAPSSLSETTLIPLEPDAVPPGVYCGHSPPLSSTTSTVITPPLSGLMIADAAFPPTPTVSASQEGAANTGLDGPETPGPVVHSHYAPFTHATVSQSPQHAQSAQNVPPVQHVQPVQHAQCAQHPLPIAPYMGEGSLRLPMQPHSRPLATKRGPFKDQVDRQKTAQTRKDGSCIRCRMQRIRCNADDTNPKGQCMGCKYRPGRPWQLPCMRLKISDVVLSKTTQVKGHEWTLRWKENTVLDDVGHWASEEERIVRISEGYTNEFVELRVRRFVPQEGDRVERSWVTPDGQSRIVSIPPYAVAEPDSIGPRYSAYIKKGLVACCNNVLSGLKNTLIWPTYWVAVNLSRRSKHLSDAERALLTSTLDLWMTVRLTTRSFEIVGDETLDMPPDILDETSPSHGKIPIPPVMGAQLDSVLIHQIQHTLKRNTLEGLHKLVTENKVRTWFTMYLVIFILLHNASLVIKHDASYARKHGIKRRFAREDKVQQYYTGAITLLAYFHYCNKGVFPFTADAREQDLRNLANLDENAMQFVRLTRDFAIAHKTRWQALLETKAYEDDFFFISQLFEVNWQPRPMEL